MTKHLMMMTGFRDIVANNKTATNRRQGVLKIIPLEEEEEED